tara:strand:+ start:11079 stop:12980 length:1902 start_codon:yes stop_codon:yes gene_type:complete
MSKKLKLVSETERPKAAIALPIAIVEHALGKELLAELADAEGSAQAIVIKVPANSWCDIIARCLRRTLDHVEVVAFEQAKPVRVREGRRDLLDALAEGAPTIAVSATPETAVPAEYHGLADRVFEIDRLDVAVVRKVIRTMTGAAPKNLRQSDLVGIGLAEAIAAIGASKTAQACVTRFARMQKRKSMPSELSNVPLLADLPLIGPVREWSDQMLVDIQRLDDGDVTPSAIRFATLEGPPGTGKSLLAASIAKSCGWQFHKTTVQDWFNAGDGHLGAVTKACAAFIDKVLSEERAIGFIDELQSIPDRARLSARGRDWWMPVIDGILVQIDRVRHSKKKVLLLGACNHYDLLDPALIRAGRLETKISVLPPSTPDEARELVRYYVGTRLGAHDISLIGEFATGATPATIEAAVRQAEAVARRNQRDLVADDLIGILAPNSNSDANQALGVALHEAGHAVVAHRLGTPVRSVSIIPSGKMAGNTQLHGFGPTPTVAEVEVSVVISLAGRAADELFGNGADAGAAEDLAFATRILCEARDKWGLYGTLAVRDQASDLAGHRFEISRHDWLEDQLGQLMQRARTLAAENEVPIRRLAKTLIERKVLHAGAIAQVIDPSIQADVLVASPHSPDLPEA